MRRSNTSSVSYTDGVTKDGPATTGGGEDREGHAESNRGAPAASASNNNTSNNNLRVASGSHHLEDDDDDDDIRGIDMVASRIMAPVRVRKIKKSSTRKSKKRSSFGRRFYVRWIKKFFSSFSSLFLAIILWYTLGVLSIATSKLLLMSLHEHEQHHNHRHSQHHNHHREQQNQQQQHLHKHHIHKIGGVPPLFLTFQQLVVGASVLRVLLHFRFLKSPGLQPWPKSSESEQRRRRRGPMGVPRINSQSNKSQWEVWIDNFLDDFQPQLLGAALCFCMGFLATNYGFSGTSASFVETIKASEPITSATVATWWGIEYLSRNEIFSLGTIVVGMLFSTLGNHDSSHDMGSASAGDAASSTVGHSLQSASIVMIANLCFSFRGLFQKLFRNSPEGNPQIMDDLNLQFRMQQIGAYTLLLPVLVSEGPRIATHLLTMSSQPQGLFRSGLVNQYIGLALLNGFAFTSYNLASTYILSRISVVHHAALNCIRRVFAIVITSLYFFVPISFMGALGILLSIAGFMSFTHYKVQRQREPKPVSSLLPVSVVN